MTRAARCALLLALAAPLAAAAAGCGDTLDARHRLEAASARHRVAFVPQPAPLAAGRHFSTSSSARRAMRRCRWRCASMPTCPRTATA